MEKRCPKCRGEVSNVDTRLYYCASCKMYTDCEDDGTIEQLLKKLDEEYKKSSDEFWAREEEDDEDYMTAFANGYRNAISDARIWLEQIARSRQ